jgi:MFS family permease
VLRFLVGVGIGSEWVTGASLVSELWPDHARGKGGGLLQSGAGIGSFLTSGVWLLIGGLGPSAWRWMYVIGVLPGPARVLDPARHAGIGALGSGKRAPPRRCGAAVRCSRVKTPR